MWYITQYSIEAKPKIIEKLRKINEDAECAFDDNWNTLDWIKWDSSTEDLIEFSKAYPKELIVLRWEWEESWDIRVEYFLNWRHYREQAEIVFKDYNRALLK